MTVTRFAPSPTGFLHPGHAFAALTAFEQGDEFLLRIEDIDQGRAREEFVAAIFEDLRWLGLGWPEPVLRQSARMGAYEDALERLAARGLVYPCFCTRKEIAAEIARAGEAPHRDPMVGSPSGPDGPVYPGTCRHLSETERQARLERGASYAFRLDMEKAARITGPLTFIEHGRVQSAAPLPFGDIVIARKEMPTSYHLAVVVDDAHQGVTLVTRGEDLLAATHVQRLLQALLGLAAPAYAHHRLIADSKGRKYSKREDAPTLRSLRAAGLGRDEIRALFAPV